MTVSELLSIWKTEMPINVYVGLDAINPRKYTAKQRELCLTHCGSKEIIEVKLADNFGKHAGGGFHLNRKYPNLLIIKTQK